MIVLRDDNLESKIDEERVARGDNTKAKTLSDLIREYLTQLEERRRQERERNANAPSAA